MALPGDLTLARIYCGAALPERADDAALLEAALRQLFDGGPRAWPGLGLAVEVFVANLARHAPRNAGRLPAPDRGPDLYLAFACVERVPGALETFDRAHLTRVGAYLG